MGNQNSDTELASSLQKLVMSDIWVDWSKKIPDCDGEFYMRDSSGGPTLYVFEHVDGVLIHGPKARSFRWEADGTGHIASAEFKRA